MWGPNYVTVEAGAIYIDIAEELEKRNLQFYINTEIGSLSAGSAACAGTKDASFDGELWPGRLLHRRRKDGAPVGRTIGSH